MKLYQIYKLHMKSAHAKDSVNHVILLHKIRITRNLSFGFPTRSDTNQAVQSQKIALDKYLGSRGIVLYM